jgi:hypothetical protein
MPPPDRRGAHPPRRRRRRRPVVVPLPPTGPSSGSGCVTGVDRGLALDIITHPADYYINTHNVRVSNGGRARASCLARRKPKAPNGLPGSRAPRARRCPTAPSKAPNRRHGPRWVTSRPPIASRYTARRSIRDRFGLVNAEERGPAYAIQHARGLRRPRPARPLASCPMPFPCRQGCSMRGSGESPPPALIGCLSESRPDRPVGREALSTPSLSLSDFASGDGPMVHQPRPQNHPGLPRPPGPVRTCRGGAGSSGTMTSVCGAGFFSDVELDPADALELRCRGPFDRPRTTGDAPEVTASRASPAVVCVRRLAHQRRAAARSRASSADPPSTAIATGPPPTGLQAWFCRPLPFVRQADSFGPLSSFVRVPIAVNSGSGRRPSRGGRLCCRVSCIPSG